MNRVQAEAVLQTQSSGTFLLRNSSAQGQIALSIRENDKSTHLLIKFDPDAPFHIRYSCYFPYNDTVHKGATIRSILAFEIPHYLKVPLKARPENIENIAANSSAKKKSLKTKTKSMVKSILTKKNSALSKELVRNTSCTFGIDLDKMPANVNGVPLFVEVCLKYIESRYFPSRASAISTKSIGAPKASGPALE